MVILFEGCLFLLGVWSLFGYLFFLGGGGYGLYLGVYFSFGGMVLIWVYGLYLGVY